MEERCSIEVEKQTLQQRQKACEVPEPQENQNELSKLRKRMSTHEVTETRDPPSHTPNAGQLPSKPSKKGTIRL